MSKGRITPKQEEILNFIKQHILSKNYPPSVREICEAVNLKSTSSVHAHLATLEKNGYISRDQSKTRAIEIVDDDFGFNLPDRELVNVLMFPAEYGSQQNNSIHMIIFQYLQICFPIPRHFCFVSRETV